jgi:hypothetical protein
MADEEVGPEAVQQLDSPTWHLTYVIESLTFYGLAIHYGARRMLWSDTPEGDRCDLCRQRLRDRAAKFRSDYLTDG